MFKSQRHAFWQALVVTIAVFAIGIFSGVLLENWRTSKIDTLYQQAEIDLLDVKLQSEIYSSGNFNCEFAKRENIEFANRIYEEAKILDRYETASRLTNALRLQHKKYDILRATLLLNSIKTREKCNASYSNVLYIYKYDEPRMDLKAKQNVFSRLLLELKQEKGDEVLLIPIAGNVGVSSIEMILDRYNVSQEELPVILINEEIKIIDLQTIEELKAYFE